MKHPDYDRAFHETPEYIRSAIELGFMKGKKAMKMRYKVTSALSIAAALVVILGAAAFGASRLGAPRPDGMLPGRPLSASIATEEPPVSDPYATPSPLPVAQAEEFNTEPTPAPTLPVDEPTPATPEPTPMPTLLEEMEIPADTEVPALDTVFYTLGGMYFHSDETCSGLQGALAGSVQDAYHAGKEPCPICLADWNFVVSAVPADAQSGLSEAQIVYMLSDDAQFRFHMDESCGGSENATMLSVGAAIELGMTPCPDCLSEDVYALVAVPAGSAAEAGTEILYATEQGAYCHADPECNGMVGAEPHTVRELIAEARNACPVCMTHWSYAVVARQDSGSVSEEITPMPTMFAVMLDGSESVVEVAVDEALSESAAYTDVMVSSPVYYYTANGMYYHTVENCSNMRNAMAHTLSEAVDSGKHHCPVCIGGNVEFYWQPVPENDGDTVYRAPNNGYYHVNPECFNTSDVIVQASTLADAVNAGCAPCPACLPSLSTVEDRPGCYVTAIENLYHHDPDCPSVPDEISMEKMDEIEAQAAGRIRCSVCAEVEADSDLAKLLVTTFGSGVADAFPGYIFERQEILANGAIDWYFSDGQSTIFAVRFSYDHADGSLSKIWLQNGLFMDRMFPRSFIEQLPAPLDVIPGAIDCDTAFMVTAEFNEDGSICAFSTETFKDESFDLPRWEIRADGTPQLLDEEISDAPLSEN